MNATLQTERQFVPARLVIISLIFVCSGLFGIWRIVSHARDGQIHIALDAAHLLVGIGLLRLRTPWRGVGSFLALLAAIVFGLACPLSLFAGEVQAPGISSAVARVIFCAGFAVAALFFVWAYRVLASPEIKALFHDSPSHAIDRNG